MNLLVLGATGRTGQHIVAQGLAKGHAITALVRDPSKVTPRDGLTLIKGTPTDAADVAGAAQNVDAILVALNNPRTSDAPWAKPVSTEKILTQVAENISALGKQRVVFLSAAGVGDSFASAPWFMKFMINRTNLKYAYADHNSAEKTFRASQTDWTLVRAMGLSNSEKEKTLIVGTATSPKPGMMVRRSAVAGFMLSAVENASHIKETPVISEK
ncbi:putative NAD(P)-binding protein [Pacificibacter maritimus]|uniref:Putative NAD(P)-binding protein n=1 Tax=Pacificibacter maritimus TaxID=762213 RepID=A0A3N4UVS7_9RHOB|nr:NAD(P)H-binding protein [Pacificibacter maritimus]RPE71599.1 putative NAD(P)-binding protein [Pacificibacter maritimus]